jgi:two-component system sensor histidine kinase HydH
MRSMLGIFSGSLVRRYSLLLLASTLVPLIVVGLLYDRYMSSLREEFTGERLKAQLAASASRLRAFLDARTYQLETLAKYPGARAGGGEGGFGVEFASLVRLEADEADLYGILIFSDGGELLRVAPGQAASGAPYWTGLSFAPERLPRSTLGDAELLGPVPPRGGESGWFLLREPLHGGGRIALHVRLASLTELLGVPSVAGALEPILRTPAGLFDLVGRPAAVRGHLLEGPEIAPGWRPCLDVDPDELVRPFQLARYTLIIASLITVGAVGWVSAGMASRLRHRVDLLAHGARMISDGDFSYRVPDAGHDEIGLFAVTFNRMASRLGQLVDQAVRMERLATLGQFSTGVAHEVRNPLATLKTTVQALARKERDPERSALLQDMEREIDRMSRKMEDMLAFGRPRPPERTGLRVRDVFRRLEALLASDARQRQVGLALQGDLDLHVLVDPDHLRQVLLNLLLNALQATPPGGLVTLRCHRQAGRVVIEVRDTGAGIPPERMREVFQPFYTTKPSGTGLGLSISRQLVQLNGGSLDLESVPGQGTTARVLLDPEGDGDAERPHR